MAARILSRCKQFGTVILSSHGWRLPCAKQVSVERLCMGEWLHTSSSLLGLEEFFEDKTLWGETEIQCGRPWKLDELRIKSNEDLHKLWYVLLKEQNMLMTMEHEYKRECELFPNPERLDKVDESMRNILEVVDERNEAYNLLETGETGKPKVVVQRNFLGIKVKRKVQEHLIPPQINTITRYLNPPYTKLRGKFLHLYAEKLRKRRDRAIIINRKRKEELRKRFPDADLD